MNLLLSLFFILVVLFLPLKTYAIYDPLSSPNNKFGIHIISATPAESSPAAEFTNSSGGDWGYITVLVESKDRNTQKWQEFFNDLRRRHLIPLIRLATQPDPSTGSWKRPYEGEETAWADFLDNLVWPTKNRYVIIYNEPNHAAEWGNQTDPASYAQTLDKTINALRQKSADFFVLNAGFDASTPHQPPRYFDELAYLEQMNQAVPGIFEKLDGWVSHSYPNPNFSGSPNDTGRGTVRTWYWELQTLRQLGVTKNLPVFITETGWKHAEGISFNRSFPSADQVAEYFQQAFTSAWHSQRIVAVTPFLLNYQEAPFDHFSFKKITGERQDQKIFKDESVLGLSYPQYYPQYLTLMQLPKTAGQPIQENQAELVSGAVYPSIVAGENYLIPLTFKNIGQSIWNDNSQVSLVPILGSKELGIEAVNLPKDIKIEPGQEYTFNLKLKAPQAGKYQVVLNLGMGPKQFDSQPLEFITEVKSPVILKIKANLRWKAQAAGEYALAISGVVNSTLNQLFLDEKGQSPEIEARTLLPDKPYDFTLTRPFYQPKIVQQTLQSGINTLDFGELQPDLVSALIDPLQLWRLLPFSN